MAERVQSMQPSYSYLRLNQAICNAPPHLLYIYRRESGLIHTSVLECSTLVSELATRPLHNSKPETPPEPLRKPIPMGMALRRWSSGEGEKCCIYTDENPV